MRITNYLIMPTTINIPVEVPNGISVDVITRQLTEYAKRIIARNQKDKFSHAKQYKHEKLCGILATDARQEELIEDYLSEKYDLKFT